MAFGDLSTPNYSPEFQKKLKKYEEEEKRAMNGQEDGSYKVELYVYDMSKGFAKQMSPALLGKQIDGIWHTGVVAYGREYFFGAGGIESVRPGGTILGEPERVEDLGYSQVPYQLFLEYIFGLGESSYRPGAYDLLKHNCNNFSEEIAEFLCGRGIPKNILSLPDEVLNTDLGEALAPLAKSLKLKNSETRSFPFCGTDTGLNAYLPREVVRDRDDPELEELNSAIEEVRHNTLILESRRNCLNEKLLKKERKERKKEKKEKKKKKIKSPVEDGVEKEVRRLKSRSDSVQLAPYSQELLEDAIETRKFSELLESPLKALIPSSFESPSLPAQSLAQSLESPTNRDRASSPIPQDRESSQTEQPPQNQQLLPSMDEDSVDITPPEVGQSPVDTPHSTQLEPKLEPEGLLPEVEQEPPIVFKDEIDTIADFDGFVHYAAEMLSSSEQKHMEELRAYIIEDEGSWALGEDFNMLFARIFHDPSIPMEAQRHLIRIMAAAALKDDVILMLHQDRREHTIMNFANKVESFVPDIQEALALFFCNMFEHLSPSEWLLYISEWAEGTQQLSNIRVTTKVAVNALLHRDPKVQEYGTALMYNLGTKEAKTVIFDDVAPELAMAILQFFANNPPEEYLWRVMTALCRFCYASSEVPALIKMIGPDPNSFKGVSERIDGVLEEINAKLSRVRQY